MGALIVSTAFYNLAFGASDTVGVVLLVLTYVSMMVLSGWYLVEGLNTGAVRMRSWRPSRAEDPFDYWFGIGLWAVMFGVTLVFAVLVALSIVPELLGT